MSIVAGPRHTRPTTTTTPVRRLALACRTLRRIAHEERESTRAAWKARVAEVDAVMRALRRNEDSLSSWDTEDEAELAELEAADVDITRQQQQ